MANGNLPAAGSLGDPQVTTGDYQTGINELLAYVRSLKADLDSLSSQVLGEAAVRDVGTGPTQLPSNSDLGTAAAVASDQNLRTTDEVSFSRVIAGTFDSSLMQIQTADVILNGDFGPNQTLHLMRLGGLVFAYTDDAVSHEAESNVSSLSGLIPEAFRPQYLARDCINASNTVQRDLFVNSNGSIGITTYGATPTSSGQKLMIVYSV